MKTQFFLIILCLFFSCGKVDCDALSEVYKTHSCKIVVKEMPMPKSVYRFYVVGKTIFTHKDTIYDEENRWFCDFYKYLEKGDTIVKSKGELLFNIYKKDTVLTFNWECEGKVYK